MLLVFAAVCAFLAGALTVAALCAPRRKDTVAARLHQVVAKGNTGSVTDSVLKKQLGAPSSFRQQVRTVLHPVGSTCLASRALAESLNRAGNPYRLIHTEFAAIRLLCGLLFVALVSVGAAVGHTTGPLKLTFGTMLILFGMALPDVWLNNQIRVRQVALRRALPDLLDLLMVSLEAGVGFDSAVALAAENPNGPWSDELAHVLQEMQLGRARADAMRSLAIRLKIDEVTAFTSAVIQADRLGTSIANTLRLQSATVRMKHVQRIREAAAKLPTKMLFPLVFFLLPALFVVIVGPGLINLIRALTH